MNPSIRTTLAAVALLLAAASAQSQTRYTYSTAGDEVTDSKTGLVWRRCSEGQTWSGTGCAGDAFTYSHEAALALAKAQSGTAGWRLPNVRELASIADKTRTRIGFDSPAIDTAAFPKTPANTYWSSTPNVGLPSTAWVVDFKRGDVINAFRAYYEHVRLVR